jgi:hypothetical protein
MDPITLAGVASAVGGAAAVGVTARLVAYGRLRQDPRIYFRIIYGHPAVASVSSAGAGSYRRRLGWRR